MTNNQVLDFLRNNKMDVASARAAVLAADVYFNAYVECGKVTGFNFSPILAYYSQGLFYQIWEEEKMVKISRKLYGKYLKNSVYLETLIRKHRKASKKIDKIWNAYFSKKAVGNEELLKIFLKFSKAFHKSVYYDAFGEDKGKFIERELIKNFAQRHQLSDGRASEILNIFSHPEVRAIFNSERIDFLKICLAMAKDKKRQGSREVSEIRKNKRLPALIDAYVKKYFWKDTDFYQTRKVTFKTAVKEADRFIEENSLAEIKAELDDLTGGHKKINVQKG